jgi:hypothetical protein
MSVSEYINQLSIALNHCLVESTKPTDDQGELEKLCLAFAAAGKLSGAAFSVALALEDARERIEVLEAQLLRMVEISQRVKVE